MHVNITEGIKKSPPQVTYTHKNKQLLRVFIMFLLNTSEYSQFLSSRPPLPNGCSQEGEHLESERIISRQIFPVKKAEDLLPFVITLL